MPGSDVPVRPLRETIKRLPDEALIERMAEGDELAFETVMRRHNRLLFRTARSILSRDADAEDVVQETYIRAFSHLADFAGEARFSTWLTRIAVNEALGRLRSAALRAERNGTAPDALDDPNVLVLPFAAPARRDDPEAGAARAEIRALVEAAIDELPASFRLVFVLRAIEEFSIEDTARCLGVPPQTVKSRFHRAKRQIRQTLDGRLDAALRDSFPFAGRRCDRTVERVLARIERPPPKN